MNQSLYLVTSFFALINDRFENRKDRGATAVEYGLMVGLIAVVIIAVVLTLGGELQTMFQSVVDGFGEAEAAAGGGDV